MENFKVILNQTVRSFTLRYNGIKWRSATTKEDVQGILDNFDEPTNEIPITLNDEVILKGGKKTLLSVIKSLFGTGVPDGGTTGQVLSKRSGENGDAGWRSIPTNSEIYIGSDQPENTFKIWVDTSMDDVDILRAIRDANPQSTYLTALFDDTKDPHTEWWDNEGYSGALFGDSPTLRSMQDAIGFSLPDILNPDKCYVLKLYYFQLINFDTTGLNATTFILCTNNQLTSDSIQNILNSCATSNVLNGYINISQGTNVYYSTWSEQAKADYVTLISRGWNIQYNNDAP